ncbi:MAG: Rieske 2Fe-2S domain-containing protein [Cryomorphaceae bacterium]|nr:Rieske 2Fe-2S domain-containing protein [Cryomorphaceae bacterium]
MNEWIKNFWYVVANKDELTEETQPLRKSVLGQDLALFIDAEGNYAAVSDICPHMGAQLSLGHVANGCIVCPYHHKEFASNGDCTKVPSIDMGGKIPSGLKVDSYPVVEKYGLIWVFMGDLPATQRPPIVEVEDLENDSEFRPLLHTFTWRGSLRPMLENLIDFTHFSYLHARTFGNGEHPFKDNYDIKKSKYEISCVIKVKLNPNSWFFPNDALVDGKSPDVTVYCRYHAPTTVVNAFSVGPYRDTTLFTFTPTKDDVVEIRMLGCRNFDKTAEMDDELRQLGEQILLEDQAVIETCVPEILPQPSLVPVDRYLGASRQLYSSFLNGNGILDHVYTSSTGRKIVVIPSPVRKRSQSFGRRWARNEEKEKQKRCQGCSDCDKS